MTESEIDARLRRIEQLLLAVATIAIGGVVVVGARALNDLYHGLKTIWHLPNAIAIVAVILVGIMAWWLFSGWVGRMYSR